MCMQLSAINIIRLICNFGNLWVDLVQLIAIKKQATCKTTRLLIGPDLPQKVSYDFIKGKTIEESESLKLTRLCVVEWLSSYTVIL